MSHLIKTLPKDFRVFYVNLRGIYVSKADDFLKVLFEVEEKEYDSKEYLRVLVEYLPNKIELPFIGGIPVPKNIFEKFFEEKEVENVFKYIERLFSKLAEKFNPVLIIDELQVIGDIKIDDLLIYKLFNLFIRLTKELHCCHVFAITSDSLFIERVYAEAMLQDRCEYLLVDDFDHETTRGFLKKYGFSEDEIELTWNYLGGKPVYLVRVIKVKLSGASVEDFCEEMLETKTNQTLDVIYELEDEDKELFEDVLSLFREFKDRDVIKYKKLSRSIKWCVRKNILFVNPFKRLVKPQSKLDLLAVRRVLEEVRV